MSPDFAPPQNERIPILKQFHRDATIMRYRNLMLARSANCLAGSENRMGRISMHRIPGAPAAFCWRSSSVRRVRCQQQACAENLSRVVEDRRLLSLPSRIQPVRHLPPINQMLQAFPRLVDESLQSCRHVGAIGVPVLRLHSKVKQ